MDQPNLVPNLPAFHKTETAHPHESLLTLGLLLLRHLQSRSSTKAAPAMLGWPIVSPFSNNYLHIKISQQSARTSRHVRSVTPTYGGVRQWTSEGQWAGLRTHSSQLARRAMERRTRPKQTHIWDHTCNGHCATMRTTRRPSSSDLQHVASVTSERGDRTSRIVAVCTGVAQGQPQSQPTIRRPLEWYQEDTDPR